MLSACSNKNVRFSLTSEMALVAYPTTKEIQERWYNSQDRAHSRQVVAKDAKQCSRMLFSELELGNNLTEDQRIKCVGLEHLLSRDLAENTKQLNEKRKRHVYKVLIEQDRQRKLKINNAEELEYVSRKSSYQSRKRSHLLAVASLM